MRSATRLTISHHFQDVGNVSHAPSAIRRSGTSKLYAAPQSEANNHHRLHIIAPNAGYRCKIDSSVQYVPR